jgi:hypothetical protein
LECLLELPLVYEILLRQLGGLYQIAWRVAEEKEHLLDPLSGLERLYAERLLRELHVRLRPRAVMYTLEESDLVRRTADERALAPPRFGYGRRTPRLPDLGPMIGPIGGVMYLRHDREPFGPRHVARIEEQLDRVYRHRFRPLRLIATATARGALGSRIDCACDLADLLAAFGDPFELYVIDSLVGALSVLALRAETVVLMGHAKIGGCTLAMLLGSKNRERELLLRTASRRHPPDTAGKLVDAFVDSRLPFGLDRLALETSGLSWEEPVDAERTILHQIAVSRIEPEDTFAIQCAKDWKG